MKKIIVWGMLAAGGWLGNVHGENFLTNPSFEGGTYGWTWSIIPADASPEARMQVEVDRTTKTAGQELGSSSLKLTADDGLYTETLSAAIVPVKEGSEYTLSFYAKATQPVNVDVYAHAPGLAMGMRSIVYIDRHQQVFQAGPEWKRYSLKINIKRPEKPGPWDRQFADIFQLYVELALRPGQTLWLDGFQLAQGELGPYDEGRPITAGVESERSAHLYQPGEKIEPKFYFYRSKADDNAPYEARFRTEECLTGKIIGEQVVALKFAPDRPILTLGLPYPISSDRQGVFKTVVQVMANGKAAADAQFIHAVYKPLPVPADFDDESIFAMDHILGGGHTTIDDYFRMASEIGVRSYRNEAAMGGEYPERGQFFFEGRPGYVQNRGAVIRTAEKYKIRPMICIGPETGGYIPAWIRTEEYSKSRHLYEDYDPNGKILSQYVNNPNAKKINLEAFGEYCYQLALHFKGRVKYYEVFNESYGWAEYPDYWRTAYENIKRADPPAKVMPNVMRSEFTVPVTNDPLNQDRFLKQHLINYCDAVSLHLYTYPVDNAPPELNLPGFEDIYASWKDLFRAGNRPEVELLETEGGHSSPSYYTYMQPDQKGADPRPGMLVQAMRSQRKWIMFQDIGYKKYFYFVFNGYGNTGWYASLLEFDDTPKLSYLATGNAARLITGAKSLGRIKFAANEKLWGYQFQMKNGERFVTVWNVEEQPAELTLEIPAAEIRAEDMLGNSLPLAGDAGKTIIPISGAPVYIFGNKGSKAWADAERVKELFAKAEAVGLVPVKFAAELVGNPETGAPAMAVLAKNVSGREFNGIFPVAGLPAEWQAESDRTAIGGLPARETGAGYVDLKCPQPTSNPISIKASYENNGKMMEVSRRIPRVTLIARKTGDIKIDGAIDEPAWTQAVEKIEINKKEQVALELEPGTLRNRTEVDRTNIIDWRGPDNFSSVHRALWDDEALYIASKVVTSNLVQKRRDRTIFNSSCIELFLSLDSAANAWDPLYKPSDYHLLFAPASDDVPTCVLDAVHDRNDAKYPLKIKPEVASRKVEGGYEMEIKIPWKNFKETEKIKTGQTFGLDIAVDAAFQDGNRQWQMVWCGGQDSCATPVNFARAILVAKAAPEGAGPAGKKISHAEKKEYLKVAEKDGFSSKAYHLVPEKQASLAYDPVNYAEGWQSLRLENRADTVPRERGVGVFIENALQNAVFTEIISEPFELEAGKTYSLSFWACSDAGLLKAWFAVVPEGYKAEPIIDQFYKGKSWPYETVVETGKAWKKYTLRFTVPRDAKGPYRQRVRYTDKAVLWLDGLKIAEKN